MRKNLTYYMTLPYEITVKELSKEDGGGVFLAIPTLGAAAVNAHGATYEEARTLLDNVKKDYFEMWLESGVPITEPQDELEKDYSGKFVLRTRKDIHAMLAAMAKEQDVSLNALVNDLINFALGGKKAFENIAAAALENIKITHVHVHNLAKNPPETAEKMKQAAQAAQGKGFGDYEECA